MGTKLARLQPLVPVGGLVQENVFKKYSSGIKSYLLSPTKVPEGD